MKNTWYASALVLGLLLTGCGHLRSAPAASDNAAHLENKEVNVGYGTLPRSRVTNSVASLSKDEIEMYRAQSVQELLNRAPGFSGGTSLIVVDGVPVRWSDLAGIDPNEIMSISKLKDAGSTVIYGFQGGGSVLVITTERAQPD